MSISPAPAMCGFLARACMRLLFRHEMKSRRFSFSVVRTLELEHRCMSTSFLAQPIQPWYEAQRGCHGDGDLGFEPSLEGR